MIKRFLMCLLVIFFMAGVVFAEGTVKQLPTYGDRYYKYGEDMKLVTFEITDDTGSVPLTSFLKAEAIKGYYIMTVEVKSSSDDSLTVLIETNLGTDLFNKAFTSATSGEIKNSDDRWPIYSTPKIDVTNMSGDTVTVNVVFVK